MLHIREEQMAVFQQQAERNFVSSIVGHLRTNHPGTVKDMPEDVLYRRVEYGIRRAREYGFSWKNSLSTFVTLMFVIAPDFDKLPAFKKFLTDEGVPPNERMELLLQQTTDADWQDAEKVSEPDNWPEDML